MAPTADAPAVPPTWTASPSKPKLKLPPGACDAHVHVFGPRARFAFGGSYTPSDAPKELLFARHAFLGIERCVIVHSAAHGYDLAATADALAAKGGAYLGVALMPVDVADAELKRRDAQGFRGVRFHYMEHLGKGAPIDDVIAFAGRLADIGWHLQIHMAADRIGELTPALKRSPVPVVIDHMGRIDASRGLEQEPFRNLHVADGGPQSVGKAERRRPGDAARPALRRRGAVRAQAVRGIRRPLRLGHRFSASQPRRAYSRRRRAGRLAGADRAQSRRVAGAAGGQSAAALPFRQTRPGQGGLIMTGRLQGRIAIVTGAGSVGPGWGNGRATCVRFAEEGAKIFAVERNLDSVAETVDKVKAVGGEIVVQPCDVTDNASVAAMVAACMKHFGRIDVLVNNVGGSAHGGPVEMAEEVWDSQMDSNLKSVFLTCKHVLPVMEKQKSGAIVNLGSTSGIRFTGAFQVGYAASKAGVIQLSRAIAVQYAPKGIRVNTVIPGQLHTPMVEARLAKQRAGGDVEALLKQRVARIPQGFMGDGRDTANAALFLASDEARFVTGTEIIVDGGMSARCD